MPVMEKDLVCGMQVDPNKAAGKSDYRGKLYYFCATSCKKFDANPEQYIDKAPGLVQIGVVAPKPVAPVASAHRHRIHLPHGSGGPPDRPRHLSQMRHGARAR